MSRLLEEVKNTYQVKGLKSLQIAPDGTELLYTRKDDLDYLIKQAEKAEQLEQENERLKKQLQDKTKFLELLINNITEEKYEALKTQLNKEEN